MIRSDHHFAIGASHSVCEDYAASLDGFAALADGCSRVLRPDGSRINAHTDIGARLLVRAAFHHRNVCDEHFHTAVLYTADGYRRQLDMSVETLSATLMTLQDKGEHYWYARVCGDGAVAWRSRQHGHWMIETYQFDGPPYYLRYAMGGMPSMWVKKALMGVDGVRAEAEVQSPCANHFLKSDADLVVAMSDGVFSFTDSNNRPVPFASTFAARLLDMRRMGGRFVLRNMTGILRNLASEGIVHQDDISMIALYDDGKD